MNARVTQVPLKFYRCARSTGWHSGAASSKPSERRHEAFFRTHQTSSCLRTKQHGGRECGRGAQEMRRLRRRHRGVERLHALGPCIHPGVCRYDALTANEEPPVPPPPKKVAVTLGPAPRRSGKASGILVAYIVAPSSDLIL